MSTTVERRVVDMEFNNQRFERNVSTTLSSLDKLKEKLNLTGAAKGLEDVGNNARRINLSGLVNAAEGVAVKFSHMQMTIQHVLNNMVDSAIRTGKRITSALTIDPIKTGLSEYETQINAVQTILANTESKGTTLGQVNAALDELNTYADKTIYNFTEMTRNIGTFTAAGVDLKTSVSAIQGIANLAAVSGSTSQQASTAMYQLSQALSSGTVKLMDWNSVVNAGMGGQVFQDALKETARVHGVNVDAMIKKHGSFRETLQEGWITADVLTETLNHFTMAAEEGTKEFENYKKSLMDSGYSEEQAKAIIKLANTATSAATEVKTATQLWDTLKETAQSGWTQTWEIIMGDFGEAKQLFSGIYNTISPLLEASAKARNELLTGGLASGWKQLMGQGIADEEGYKDVFQTIAKEQGIAFDEMIKKEGSFEAALKKGLQNGLTSQKLETRGYEVDEELKATSLTSDMLTESVTKLADKMRNMSEEERAAAGYTQEHVKQIEALEQGLKDGSISMDEFRDKIIKPSGRENIIEGLKNAFDGVLNIMRPIKEAFRDIFPPMTAEKLYSFTESFRNLTERFKEFTETHGDKIRTTFKGIFSILDIGWTFIKKLAGGIGDLLGKFKGFGGGVLDTTANIGEWLSGLRDTVKETDIFGKAIDKVVGFLGKIIDKLKEFWATIKDAFDLPGVDGFLGLMEGIWNVITKIGSKIGKIFAPIGKAVGNLFGNGTITDLVKDGLFAGLLVGATRTVSSLKSIFDDFSGEDGLFAGIKDTLDSVKGCFEAYQNSLNAEALKKIAVAIAILAASIFVIASIDGAALDHALGAIGILFGELLGAFAIFNKITSNKKGLVKATSAIVGLASAVLLLSFGMKVMSTMSWDEIGRGIVGTVVGLGALVGAVNLLPEKNLNKSAKAIKKLATALVILAAGMKIMASMSWEELARGIVGTVVGLGALVGAVNLLPKDAAKRTLGMVGLATAMVILGGALKIMASMSWEEIGKGLAAMGGGLAEIVVAMNLMPKDAALRSLGMVGLATAMVILGAAIKSMGGMSWEEIGKGLAAMGGALLEIAIALNLMRGTLAGSAALIIAAGALAILAPVLKNLGGMSWEEIGKALLALAGAFAVIGVAGLLLGPVVPAILGLAGAIALLGVGVLAAGAGLVLLGAGITALSVALSAGAAAIVAGLSAIIMGLVDLIPSVVLGLGEGILAFCEVIKECAPAIVETLFVLVAEICATLATYTPIIANALFDLLIGALNVLAERMPELIQSAVNVISSFFTGIADALSGMDMSGLLKGVVAFALIGALSGVLAGAGQLATSAMAGVIKIGLLIAELAIVIAAIGALAQIPGLEWLIEEGGDFLQTVGTAIGQFVGGIVGGIAEGATSTLPQVGTNLSDFMTNLEPFITGMSGIDASVLDNAGALASAILKLTAADLLSGIASFFSGGETLADFGVEIGEFGKAMKAYSKEVQGIDTEAVDTSAAAGVALMKMASDIPGDGLFGGDGIDDFGENLVDFGESIMEYADTVKDIDGDAITASAAAATSLFDLAGKIPGDGLFGGDGIDDFGENVADFGKSIMDYANTVKDIDGDAITASVTAAASLFDLAAKVPEDGWLGTDGIDDFGDNIVDFAECLVEYADTIAEANIDSIKQSVHTIQGFMRVIKGMAGMDTSGVDLFASAVEDLTEINFREFVDTFSASTTELANAGTNMFDSIIEGVKSSRSRFVAAAKSMLDFAIQGMNSKGAQFKATGIELISKLINGVLNAKSRVSAAFNSSLSTALSSINDYYNKFYSAGGYLVTGFANGISANSYKVKAKAKAMAQAAVDAAEAELDINSPSRVGYGIGDFFGIGFVNAIADSAKNAYDASSSMAESAKTGLVTAFDKIDRIINGEMDISPTIRPVLDLTNVKSGASSINDMFSLRPSIDVLSHVGAVNAMMNQRNQNGGSDEIVSAIKGLRKDLANVGNTTNYFGGISYSHGDEIEGAIATLVRYLKLEGRS